VSKTEAQMVNFMRTVKPVSTTQGPCILGQFW